jgi:hypothetical protein
MTLLKVTEIHIHLAISSLQLILHILNNPVTKLSSFTSTKTETAHVGISTKNVFKNDSCHRNLHSSRLQHRKFLFKAAVQMQLWLVILYTQTGLYESNTCFLDFLIIGCGFSSSSEKARVRGSNSRPDDASDNAKTQTTQFK